MVKTLISIICSLIILTGGAIYETDFISRQFVEMNDVLAALYEKTDSHTATENDVLAAQSNWVNKKQYLHIFIPHNEIKEIDLWLAEAVIFVRDKEWTDALSKLEVLIELCEQIPKTFAIRFENIF